MRIQTQGNLYYIVELGLLWRMGEGKKKSSSIIVESFKERLKATD